MSRLQTVREALGQVTSLPPLVLDDWPLRGPSARLELSRSIRAVSDDVAQFHEHFNRSAGLNADRPANIEQRELLSVLLHPVCFDQLNVMQLTGAEACRR